MVTRRRAKPFRADDAGARQRSLHWLALVVGLAGFVPWGLPGMMLYVFATLLLHARPNQSRSRNAMEWLLDEREAELARGWRALYASTGRRAVSIPPRRPPRFVAIFGILAAFIGATYLGFGLPAGVVGAAARLGIASAAATVAWLACFGFRRRTLVVLGTDGVSIDGTFVPYETIVRCEVGPLPEGGALVHRTSAAPLAISGDAGGVIHALRIERARASARSPEPLLTAGFRENASQVGWRVRVRTADRETRGAVLDRMPPDQLEELRETTADAELEAAIADHLSRRP